MPIHEASHAFSVYEPRAVVLLSTGTDPYVAEVRNDGIFISHCAS